LLDIKVFNDGITLCKNEKMNVKSNRAAIATDP